MALEWWHDHDRRVELALAPCPHSVSPLHALRPAPDRLIARPRSRVCGGVSVCLSVLPAVFSRERIDRGTNNNPNTEGQGGSRGFGNSYEPMRGYGEGVERTDGVRTGRICKPRANSVHELVIHYHVVVIGVRVAFAIPERVVHLAFIFGGSE